MKPIIFYLFDKHPCINKLKNEYKYEIGELNFRSFPDGESYIKFKTDIKNKDIILFNSLNNPNEKVIPLIFAAEIAKNLGAKSVGLCAPYLSYMRQDNIFNPGEVITSKYFAKLLSSYFDYLITVDPHLHRYKNL